MATVAKPEIERVQWVRIPATWELYLQLDSARGDKAKPRYTFIDGRLTIVSPGFAHESWRLRLVGLVDDLPIGLRQRYFPSGSVTLKGVEPSRRGTESDVNYYLTNIEKVKGKKRIRMGEDPASDLAIEVVVSHPVDDALEVLAGFGVREVWVVEDERLTFLVLRPDGLYEESAVSRCLPVLTSADLIPWVFRDNLPDETELRIRFREWVSDVPAPRLRP